MSKYIIRFLPVVLIIAVVTLLFGKTLFPPSGKIIYGGDIQEQFYFWKSYFSQNLKDGIIPFWNPYSFSGTPFLAHPSTAALYPGNLIFLLFPIHVAFSIYLFIHITLAGIFMYLSCRKYTDKISSLIGAFIFSLSGMFAARVFAGHIDIISTLIWMPLVITSSIFAIEKKRKKYVLFAIISLTLQILAGYQFVVFLTLCFILLYIIYKTIISVINKSRLDDRKLILSAPWFSFLLIIIASYGLSAIQILPTIEFVRHSIRSDGLPYEATTWGSYTFETFRLFLSPFQYGYPLPEGYTYRGPGPNFYELSYFAGITPLILFGCYFILQIFHLFRSKKIDSLFFFYTISFLVFACFALGSNSILHKFLYDLVPPFRLFRFPAQFLMITPYIIGFISAIVLSTISQKYIKIIILTLLIIELIRFSKPFYRIADIPTKTFDTHLINTLQNDRSIFRLLPDYPVTSFVRHAVDFEAASLYKIPATSGYNPIVLKNYYDFIDAINNSAYSSILQYNVEIPPPNPKSVGTNFLNAKYILVDPLFNLLGEPTSDSYSLIIKKDFYSLFENKSALPRFFLVQNMQILKNKSEVIQKIKIDPDFSSKIYLYNSPEIPRDLNCEEKLSGNVQVIKYELNNITVRVQSNCPAVLSSSEIYYPGWIAKLDGKIVDLLQSNIAFKSLYIPQGLHEVEFLYLPYIYYIGGGISIVTVICLLIYLRKI